MPGGRPSGYGPDIANAICERIADGQSLRTVCRDPEMPTTSAVLQWLIKHEEFAAQYARACEARSDAFIEEMQEIAHDGRNDWMAQHDDAGEVTGWKLNGEAVQRSKLRIDTMKWIASKLKPKKYGDKLDLEHSGTIGVKFETVYETAPKSKK